MARRFVNEVKSTFRRPWRAAPREPAPASPPISSRPASQHTTQPECQPTPSKSISTDPETPPLPRLQERLWNRAYDELKSDGPKLVEAYEKILSAKIRGTTASEPTENEIGQTHETRYCQMQQLVQQELDRTQKQASINESLHQGIRVVQEIRGIVDKAVKAAPEAAVAWVGVCIGLEVCIIL